MFLIINLLRKGKKMRYGRNFTRTRKPAGFTLIELLVVIAIIALLLSILMPSLSKVKHMAKSIACASNLKNGMLSLRMYTGDYNGRLPGMWPDYWYRLIAPYSGLGIAYVSQDSDVVTTAGYYNEGYENSFGAGWARCPAAKKDALVTYAGNYPGAFRYEPGYYAGVDKSANLDKIPSKVFILSDSYLKIRVMGPTHPRLALIGHPMAAVFNWDESGNGRNDSHGGSSLLVDGPYNGWDPRHREKGNMVFVDNSVRLLWTSVSA